MGIKDHGYYGFAFVGARPLQIVSLITVVGLVGHFIAEIARAKLTASGELIGTLVITCLSVLWTLLSLTAYDDTHIPYFVTCALDTLCLVPFIVMSALLGQPLSFTTCSDLPKAGSTASPSPDNQNGNSVGPDYLAVPLGAQGGDPSRKISYVLFVGADQSTCYELMAVWGLGMALCCLFAISAFATAFLFIGKRRANRPAAPPSPDAEMQYQMRRKDTDDASSFHSAPAPPPPGPMGTHSRPQTPPVGGFARMPEADYQQ